LPDFYFVLFWLEMFLSKKPCHFVVIGSLLGSRTLTEELTAFLQTDAKQCSVVILVDSPSKLADISEEKILMELCEQLRCNPAITPEEAEELFKGFSSRGFPLHEEDLSGVSLVQNHPNFRTVRIRGPTWSS
jgi:hypothetical protein